MCLKVPIIGTLHIKWSKNCLQSSYFMSSLFKTVNLFFERVYFPSWGRMQDGECGAEAKLGQLLEHQSTIFGFTDLQQLLTFKPTDKPPPTTTWNPAPMAAYSQQCSVPRVSCRPPILLPRIPAAGRHTEFPWADLESLSRSSPALRGRAV